MLPVGEPHTTLACNSELAALLLAICSWWHEALSTNSLKALFPLPVYPEVVPHAKRLNELNKIHLGVFNYHLTMWFLSSIHLFNEAIGFSSLTAHHLSANQRIIYAITEICLLCIVSWLCWRVHSYRNVFMAQESCPPSGTSKSILCR